VVVVTLVVVVMLGAAVVERVGVELLVWQVQLDHLQKLPHHHIYLGRERVLLLPLLLLLQC
jgi:hypothetical protein